MGITQDKMKADLELLRYAKSTRHTYLAYAKNFVAYFMRPAETLGEAEIREFLLHLVRKKIVGEAGHKTALISSGIPTFLVEDLANRLDADYAFGIELKTVNGRLTGEIEGEVLRPNGKASVLKTILKKEGLSPQDCVVVADDRNNQQMFPLSSVRIGYNPDFVLTFKSDYVVNDDLSRILPIINEESTQTSSSTFSSNDAIR